MFHAFYEMDMLDSEQLSLGERYARIAEQL